MRDRHKLPASGLDIRQGLFQRGQGQRAVGAPLAADEGHHQRTAGQQSLRPTNRSFALGSRKSGNRAPARKAGSRKSVRRSSAKVAS
jgi:hypothetical protein